jgi:hypothetical protein
LGIAGVSSRHGYIRVDPKDMKIVHQQEMDEDERQRIRRNREDYLDWVHTVFEEKVIEPPKWTGRVPPKRNE